MPITPPPTRYLDIAQAMTYTEDEDATRALLQMVAQRLPQDIEQIRLKLDLSDLCAAGQLLHALKGVIPMFCCASLVEQVTQAEAMAKSGAEEAIKKTFTDLAPILLTLLDEIRAYLSRPPTTTATALSQP